jgi:hypothetical protein
MTTIYLTRDMNLKGIRAKYSKTGIRLHDRIANGANYMLKTPSVEALIVTEDITLELPINSQRDYNRGEDLYMELVEGEEETDPKLLKGLASALNVFEENRREASDEVEEKMTVEDIEKLLKGSYMKIVLRSAFAEELLDKAKNTSEERNISLEDSLRENLKHHIEVVKYDAARTGWANALDKYCRGVVFNMPYGNYEIEERFKISPDSYWYSIGRGLETIARKLYLI